MGFSIEFSSIKTDMSAAEGVNHMIIDEKFFAGLGEDRRKYASGVILPDGSYRLTQAGHLHTLMDIMAMSANEIWEKIPKNDSPLFWLIEHTGCVITDENSTVGLAMTPEQEATYRRLVAHDIIADKYFDLTGERKKAAQMMAEQG